MPASKPETRFRGIGIAPGIAHAPVIVHREANEEIPVRDIANSELPGEIARFQAALVATRVEILEMQKRIEAAIGTHDAGIFDAHLLVVEDRTLIDEVLRSLESRRQNVEHIFAGVSEKYCHTLEQMDDPYLKERAVDIQDVSRRILSHLLGKSPRAFAASEGPHILAARVLTPSDTALLDRSKVAGFATEIGSRTSHAAIMARSLGIPAVAGLHEAFGMLETGDNVLIDGTAGLLIVNPSRETLEECGRIEQRRERIEAQLDLIRSTPPTTRDGRRITLSANIELPQEMAEIGNFGVEGVGLFRTEYVFLNRQDLPSEEEQFESYRLVAEMASPHEVVLRTLDVGGDKLSDSLEFSREENPFLGCRAIRYCLRHPDLFRTQLRAILRASAFGTVRLLFPMISSIDEMRSAKALLDTCREELASEGKNFAPDLQVGAMIEIPGAALCAPQLAQEASFFSIGTNDLIQYTLAVDRGNDVVADLYNPTHPAILRLLQMIMTAAREHDIWVGLCGEMAGDITLTPLLLGLGIERLSMAARSAPRVKKAIQSLDFKTCSRLAEEALACESGAEILGLCEKVSHASYADLLV